MLASSHRFHGYNSLKPVYRLGRNVRGPLLSLRFMEHQQRQNWRCAVVVSRKTHKSAVVRNRIRRRIYHIIRDLAPGIKPGHDLVFTAHSDQLAKLENPTLIKNVTDLLQSAKILPGVQNGQRHDMMKDARKDITE